MSDRPLRPIAPKTGPDPPTPNHPSEDNRNKRSSNACSECKHRRIRCSVDSASGPPCSECALHGRECVFDERLDKRRKVAREQTEELLRKTQEERNHARGCLEYLLNAIRYSDRADVDALIDAIRDGATDNQIPMLIAQITHLSPTSYVSDSPEWYVRPDRIADGVPDGVADGVTDNMLDGYGSQP